MLEPRLALLLGAIIFGFGFAIGQSVWGALVSLIKR